MENPMTDTRADFNRDSRFCPHCRHLCAVGGRESIWSVSPAWKTAFFSIFSVSTLITTIAIIARQIANRGDAAIMETYRSTAELRRVATGVWTYPRRRSRRSTIGESPSPTESTPRSRSCT